jgi:UDP-N-acetyl-D-mannosaminuronic acid transferase (WecB/TagA/CpsF family)
MNRVHIKGVPIDVVTAEHGADWVLTRINQGVRTKVAAVNAAIIVMGAHDNELCEDLQNCDLVIADGKMGGSGGNVSFPTAGPSYEHLAILARTIQSL